MGNHQVLWCILALATLIRSLEQCILGQTTSFVIRNTVFHEAEAILTPTRLTSLRGCATALKCCSPSHNPPYEKGFYQCCKNEFVLPRDYLGQYRNVIYETSKGLTRSKKDEEAYEVPIAAGLIAVHPLNLSVEYLPIPLTPSENEQEEHSENEPYFDPASPRDVTAYSGKTAYLACRVFNIGNRTVSWIRHTDIHILSVGTYTYTSDQRYVTLFDRRTGDWTLQIKWVNSKDEGTYGCQLNTQPVKSYFIMLTVVGKMPSKSTYPEIWWEKENNLQHRMLADVADVPAAYIAGDGDMYVSLGSTLNLTCILNTSDSQLFWYHDGEIINYDSLRGGITIIVEKSNHTVSTLHIKNTRFDDSGNYTCSPSNANSASTVVHVIKDDSVVTVTTNCTSDQPAAMYKGDDDDDEADEDARAVGTGLLFSYIPFVALCYIVLPR